MIRQHDLIYFYGSGDKFFRGAYIDDLPRAVQARISGELSRRLAEEDRQRAEERRRAEERAIEARRREERERAEDERRRVDERRREAEKEAEARRRAAERQLEIERLETERQAEIAKREAIKRERLAAIDKANGVLRDIVLDCIRREMDSIVKSGEAAEVLANVSMTLCAKEIDRTVDGLITYQQIERDTAAFSSSQSEMLRAAAKGALREQVVAVAVKAKAARASGPTTY